MVIPCSRSARRPSVSRARSTYSSPRARLVRSTASSWSSKICLESNSSRPISVDLPSSTEPAVAKRSISIRRSPGGRGRRGGPGGGSAPSEVPLPLAVLHRRLRRAVVDAGRPALGDAGDRGLGDHRLDVGGERLDRRRAGHVPDGAVADAGDEGLLLAQALPWHRVRPERQQHPVAAEDLAAVGEIDGGELDLLAGDVLPDVELGPVGEREDAEVLSRSVAGVVEAPQLGALVARVPLPELVAQGEDALLGPRLLLVAPAA